MTHALRVDGVATRDAARATAAAEAEPLPYAGLVTRTIAFVLDAALIDGVAALLAAVVGVLATLLHVSSGDGKVLAVVGGGLFVAWASLYFVVFWSTTGQTPGDRLMQIRVTRSSGAPLRPRYAVVRLLALAAAVIPLGAGVIPILFTRRRRGLQDFVAGTVVTQVPAEAQAAVASRVPAGHSPRRD